MQSYTGRVPPKEPEEPVASIAEPAPPPERTEEMPEVSEPETAPPWEPPVAQRTYLGYNVQPAIWTEEAGAFPPGWLEAAKQAVLTEKGSLSCAFTRGFLYDFDWDGRMEAILLLSGPQDGTDASGEESHFVYMNPEGKPRLLASGMDAVSIGARKMDASILHYPSFDHLMIRTGTDEESGCFIYQIQNGAVQEELSASWVWPSSPVFLQTAGGQNMGAAFWFWDTERQRYSAVGPVSMPVEAFLQTFDGADFCDMLKYQSEDFRKNLRASGIDMAALTSDMIESVDVYGGRYYQITFTEKGTEEAFSVMTLKQSEYGGFSGVYGPGDGSGALSRNPERAVGDAGFLFGEEQAQTIPEGLAGKLGERIAGNPIDYQRVCDGKRTYELVVTDVENQQEPETVLFADAYVFVWQRHENGALELLHKLAVNGRVSPEFGGFAHAPTGGGLFLSDADFDGKPDLLIHQGLFGTQAYSAYACFLQRDGGFVEEKSFSAIMNPYVDAQEKAVCAFWRNSAVSHSWARYEYRDGQFMETARVTSEPYGNPKEGEDIRWKYTCQVLYNGELRDLESIADSDYSRDALWEKLSGYGCGFGRISQSYAAQPDFSPLHY